MTVKKIDTTKKIANVFCKNIYKLHGFPKVIVSDRDTKFKGNLLKNFIPPRRNISQHDFGLSPQEKWSN